MQLNIHHISNLCRGWSESTLVAYVDLIGPLALNFFKPIINKQYSIHLYFEFSVAKLKKHTVNY